MVRSICNGGAIALEAWTDVRSLGELDIIRGTVKAGRTNVPGSQAVQACWSQPSVIVVLAVVIVIVECFE